MPNNSKSITNMLNVSNNNMLLKIDNRLKICINRNCKGKLKTKDQNIGMKY